MRAKAIELVEQRNVKPESGDRSPNSASATPWGAHEDQRRRQERIQIFEGVVIRKKRGHVTPRSPSAR